jgi:hypothetical protein
VIRAIIVWPIVIPIRLVWKITIVVTWLRECFVYLKCVIVVPITCREHATCFMPAVAPVLPRLATTHGPILVKLTLGRF